MSPSPEGRHGPEGRFRAPRAVITDWGGVLTSPLREAVDEWLAADHIDVEHYKTVMTAWVAGAYGATTDPGASPVHGLEDGSLPPEEFERQLAARLRTVDGGPVPARGLLRRMFDGFRPVEPMYEALRAARSAGVMTALLSNSWGNEYPRELFAELFDAVVISSEVGMRKPDQRIFQHAVALLGLDPADCVFIDDIEHNIRAAEAVGMVGLLHTSADATVARLAELGILP